MNTTFQKLHMKQYLNAHLALDKTIYVSMCVRLELLFKGVQRGGKILQPYPCLLLGAHDTLKAYSNRNHQGAEWLQQKC